MTSRRERCAASSAKAKVRSEENGCARASYMTDPTPRRYIATYAVDGRAWIGPVHEPGVAKVRPAPAAARRYARSALAVHLELGKTDPAPEVVDDIRLPAEISDEVGRLIDQRSKAERLRTEVAEATRVAAVDLRRLGLSTRDVGDILGISGARVAQIENESDHD